MTFHVDLVRSHVATGRAALSQAFTCQDRAARVRFDWDAIEPVIAKIHEEIGEVGAAESNAEREAEMDVIWEDAKAHGL